MFETLIFIKAREKMNNINENQTDERTPGGEKNKAELKWFIEPPHIVRTVQKRGLQGVEQANQ